MTADATTTKLATTIAGLRVEYLTDLAKFTGVIEGEFATRDAAIAEIRADVVRLDSRVDAAQGTSTQVRPTRNARSPRPVSDPTGTSAVQDSGEAWQKWLSKLTDSRREWVAPMHAAGVPLAEAKRTYAAAVATFRGDGVAQDRNVFTRPAIAGAVAPAPRTNGQADAISEPRPVAPAAPTGAPTLQASMSALVARAKGASGMATGDVVVGGMVVRVSVTIP